MQKIEGIVSRFLPYLIFILPFFQLIFAYSYQHSLVSASPSNQSYNRAAYRDIYVGAIRQGQRGFWTTAISYTTENQPRIFGFNFFFILLGQLNRILRLDPVNLLHLTQYAMGPLLFLATYVAYKKLLPKTLALYAYFFTFVIETGFYIKDITEKAHEVWLPSFDWQQQIIERHFGLPHHTFGKALGILFSALFIICIASPTKKRFILLALLSGIGGFLLPPYFFVFYICCGIPLGILSLFRKKLVPFCITSMVSGISFLLVSLFLKIQFSVIPALAHYTEMEKSWWDTTDTLVRYGSSLLFYYPFLLLGVFALIVYWKHLSFSVRSLALVSLSWIITPVFLILLSNYPWFPFANARLVDGYQYVPAGILSALGLWGVLELFSTRIKTIAECFLLGGITIISTIITSIMINNFLYIHSKPWSNIYPPKETWAAVDYLSRVPKDSGILSLQYTGELLPGYADVVTYAATSGLTWPKYETRLGLAQRFFSGTMEETEARLFLKNNHIDYVFDGTDEQRLRQTPNFYPNLLYVTYKNALITIYTPK